MNQHVDIVIVGAGPVGLLLAIELTLGGARVLVLERLAAPSTALKAQGCGPLGIEALQRRGMSATIAAAEAPRLAAMMQPGVQQRSRSPKAFGHFAGLLLRSDAQREPERRMRPVDQQTLEAVLAERARALGIAVRRECDVTGFMQRGDRVEVAWASPTGGGGIRCAYLVGCDGGRSSVRKMAGFAFPGTPPTMTMYSASCDIDLPRHSSSPGFRRGPGGMFFYGPVPRMLGMLDFSGPPADREAPVTREEVEAVLRRISGMDVHVAVLDVANRWTDNTRLADTYRAGRVLLAGDAAHVHSPFGGQGMSLGLVDAANLGWKLASVVRGDMPDSLLDTYTAERRPVAEAVMANTLAQAAIMRPDPQAGAMRDLIAGLLQMTDVNRRFGEMMSGLSTRYDLGSEHDEVGRLIGDRPIGLGEAVTSLYDVIEDGRGLFLDAGDGTGSSLVAAAASKVRCVPVPAGSSMLIRPDGCIAWAAEDHSLDGLAEALRRWFVPHRAVGAATRAAMRSA